jgi:hypothetical protein
MIVIHHRVTEHTEIAQRKTESRTLLERFSNECGTTTKIVGAGLVPARVLMKLTGRDKPCPYSYTAV